MRGAFHAPVAVAAMLVLGLAQTGCVTSKKYKMAKEGASPPAALDWRVSAPSADLTVRSVIVIKGPGSWKREARWDEYVVVITNRGAEPMVIVNAALVDLLGQPQVPGTEPWSLEKLSYTNWDKYGKTGLKLLAGAGAVALYGGVVAASAVGSFLSTGVAGGGGTAVLSAIPIVALVDLTAVAIINNQNKKKIVVEFDRRRLSLPLMVAAGKTVSGSFFFPMTPGPQRLLVRGNSGPVPLELVLELKPLAALHLKPSEVKTKSP